MIESENDNLSFYEIRLFYNIMLKWEKDNLIDYSLMKGADYMQRTLVKKLGIDYKPLKQED
jgi:hypothetical protein